MVDNRFKFIIGPGGAGKSTCAPLLGKRLGCSCFDLDYEYTLRYGNISEFIDNNGYENYYSNNSKLFENLLCTINPDSVVALSSGFLAYPDVDVVNRNSKLLHRNGVSICLLPSDDFEHCVSIIVNRQMNRGFCRSREGQERTIRKRFWIYKECGDIQIYSAESPEIIVQHIIDKLNLHVE